ncbi:MAG: GNAT family N-acetyltransferase [Treponema sp.]|jgi:GNAT superfamily N-acetyltransferase|nr:GNAT family N-acetyltransferase [Treponema sp.]
MSKCPGGEEEDAGRRRWRRVGLGQSGLAETLLREREPLCVAASSRFLGRSFVRDRMWALGARGGKPGALLFYMRYTFFPLFNGPVPVPRFMGRLLRKTPLHAVQGLGEDALILEDIIARSGLSPAYSIDYDLMSLDRAPAPDSLRAGPKGLSFRRPGIRDLEALLPLQEAYEREEVLPEGAVFNPGVCRLNLKQILTEQRVISAELDGWTVAKANTSALSFTRYQIGGVYVHPAYRGRGIARRLCAELARELLAEGKGLSLFVKKRNHAARSVYRGLGFETRGDYRISYYQ